MPVRKYTPGVHSSLFTLSRGYCYQPDCKDPVVRFIDSEPFVNVEIAHIYALNSGGPRFNRELDTEFLNSFTNLLLLCRVHHKAVDRLSDAAKYPVDLLASWKRIRENGLDLTGLGAVTDADLDVILPGAVEQARDEILAAIEHVADGNKEIATMLTTLVEERFEQPHIDADMVNILAGAALSLQMLPDHASVLAEAARNLSGLGDNIGALSEAAARLAGLGDLPGQIDGAASRLQDSANNAMSGM